MRRWTRSAHGWRSCTARLDAPPGDEAMWVALADARARFPISAQALHDFVDGGLMDLDRQRYDIFDELRDYCAHVAGAVGVACIGVYGADQPQVAETLGIALQLINVMRDVKEDWELGRVYLPQDELAAHGVSRGRHRRGPRHAGVAGADGLPGRARARRTSTRASACCARSTGAAPPASARSQASTARRWSASRRAASTSSTASRSSRCRRSSGSSRGSFSVRVGGRRRAASRASPAALELIDRGHEVVLHEARPTLGGAVQTLPEREGDPPPPPDNGQHIGLGCFTEWQRFLARIGKAGALRREKLRLPVIDERGRVATIAPGPRPPRLLASPAASRFAYRPRCTSDSGTVP